MTMCACWKNVLLRFEALASTPPTSPTPRSHAEQIARSVDVLAPSVHEALDQPRDGGGPARRVTAIGCGADDHGSRGARLHGADAGLQNARGLSSERSKTSFSSTAAALARETLEKLASPPAHPVPCADRRGPTLARRPRARQGHTRASVRRLAVDPQVRGRADQVHTRILQIGVDLSHQAEHAHQRVLREVLAVPDVSRQTGTVPVQRGAERRHGVQIASPRQAHLRLDGENSVGGVRGIGHACSSSRGTKTRRMSREAIRGRSI
jgi:hypothetical protein